MQLPKSMKKWQQQQQNFGGSMFSLVAANLITRACQGWNQLSGLEAKSWYKRCIQAAASDAQLLEAQCVV